MAEELDRVPEDAPLLSFRDRYALRTMQDQWDFERKMTDLMEKSPAYKDYYGAALEARKSIIADGLIPELSEKYEVEYSLDQGIKAACLAREDSEASNRVQLRLLERLDHIHSFQLATIERLNLTINKQQTATRLAWVCTALLAYIAIQLS